MLDIKVENDVLGLSCKHVIHCPAISEGGSDLHFIKEHIVHKDGSIKPNIRLLKDYERPFYVTKPELRKNKDKKEDERIKNTNKYLSTQSNLIKSIQRATEQGSNVNSLKRLSRSRSLYGSDITAAAIIKKEYFDQWPEQSVTKSTVAAYDTETSVLDTWYKDEVMIAGLTFGKTIVIGVLEDFVKGIDNPIEKIIACAKTNLSHCTSKDTEYKIKLCKTPGECCAFVIEETHKLMPDFISIWNIDFDVPKTLSALEKYGYDPAEVLSDPSVPKPMKFFNYKTGPRIKKKQNGEETPIPWHEQWHTLYTPSSSYWVDAACVYRKIRFAKGMQQGGYSLDNILNVELGLRKLKFDDLLEETAPWIKGGTLEWHRYMQENHPIEYVVYNMFDSIGLELLDQKTLDLSTTLPVQIEISEFAKYSSQPGRIADDLHFKYLDKGCVIGTVSDQMADDNDKLVVGIDDWIVTLAAERMLNHGIKCIEESPQLETEIYLNNYDIDIEGTYPNIQVFMNISKRTTARELVSIEGLSASQRRMIGINLTGGRANGYYLSRVVHKAPTFMQLLKEFDRETV